MCQIVLSRLAALTIFILSEARDAPALDDICARHAWSFCLNRPNPRPAPSNFQIPAADVPPSNSAPSSASTNRRPPPSSTREYCGQYEPHYSYFCDGADAKENTKASDFCSDYLSNCLLPHDDSAVPQPPMATTRPPILVPCVTYQPQYTRNCNQVVSDPNMAQFCQSFQTYCGPKPMTTPPPATPLPDYAIAADQIKEKCLEYKTAAKLYCTGPVVRTESDQVKKYCDLFRQYCVATGFAQLS